MGKQKKKKTKTYEKPVSLHPLSLEEALKKLLQVPVPKKKKKPR
jgi:hypothetical protein